MITPYRQKPSNRGSALITVILVITVLAVMAATSLNYSLQSYRSGMRQNLLDQAKLTAEGEMEFLFFKWKNEILTLTPEVAVASALKGNSFVVDFNAIAEEKTAPALDNNEWEVSRALKINGVPQTGTTDVSGSTRAAQVSYFTALTRATRTHPILGTVHYQMGRRFALTKTALFQFSVFYQDVMEFSTGSPMTIIGDISSNGSLYIGAQSGVNLTVVDKIFFVNSFNGATTAADAIDETKANKFRHNSDVPNTLDNPNFISDPDQSVARENQIKKLETAENFLGGTDVGLAMSQYGAAYPSVNDVYRSVIAPAPRNALGVPIPEDPVVNANRMSEKAGIIIEVRKTTDPDYSDNPIKIYTQDNPATDYAVTNPTLAKAIIASVRKPVFDTRENTEVNITTIDVSNLKTALQANDTPPALKNAYNGIIYAYDPNPQSQAAGGSPSVLNGIRLINASELPYAEVNGKPLGFTVASDNGVYIQGDYNTQNPKGEPNTNDTAGNPAAIMADAITLLSSNWDDAKATADVSTDRLATTTAVYAALLSGNTPTNTAAGVNSGGVQNLIRLMENWTGQNVKMVGSLGQLFESKYFTSAIRQTGSNDSANNINGRNLYLVPSGRELTFDPKLASAPPNGAPTTTRFKRGDYFIWQLGDNPSSL